MASQSNNISLSEDTSILFRQILEEHQQQAMLVLQQQQAMPASQLQAQTLQETGTEIEVVTSNRNEAQTQEASLSDDDFTEVLINEVQSMPILWLRSCPDYKRADKKKIVWSNVAAKLKYDGEYSIPIV